MEKHSNFLAVYLHLLERLKQVEGVKAVKEMGELAELIKRKSAPLDGTVYVAFGGNTPTSDANNGKFQTETLYFTLVYCATYLPNGASKLHTIGKVLTAIQAAFQGWQPDAHLTDSAFRREKSPSIEYHDGFAFYPITFSVDVSIVV